MQELSVKLANVVIAWINTRTHLGQSFLSHLPKDAGPKIGGHILPVLQRLPG